MDRVGVPTSPQALDDEPHVVVGYRESRVGAPIVHAVRRRDETLELRGRQRLIADDGSAYLAAGVAGLGVLALPRDMAHAPLARAALVPLFEDWQLEPMALYLAYPNGRHVSRKLRVFIDWMVDLISRQASGVVPPKERDAMEPAGRA